MAQMPATTTLSDSSSETPRMCALFTRRVLGCTNHPQKSVKSSHQALLSSSPSGPCAGQNDFYTNAFPESYTRLFYFDPARETALGPHPSGGLACSMNVTKIVLGPSQSSPWPHHVPGHTYRTAERFINRPPDGESLLC